MKTTTKKESPQTAPEAFIFALDKLGFKPGRWDSKATRIFDLRNAQGHPEIRIAMDYEGEPVPQSLTLVKFTGTQAQLIEWETQNMSTAMPTAGLLALIEASAPTLKVIAKAA